MRAKDIFLGTEPTRATTGSPSVLAVAREGGQIGTSRARGHNTDTRTPSEASDRRGNKTSVLFMSADHEFDIRMIHELVEDWINLCAGYAKDKLDSGVDQRVDNNSGRPLPRRF